MRNNSKGTTLGDFFSDVGHELCRKKWRRYKAALDNKNRVIFPDIGFGYNVPSYKKTKRDGVLLWLASTYHEVKR
ncbi:hypothetical protein GCM10023337_16600 [Paenalcaligenes hermetiae]|uniref:Uncharacterized protein n=1 Tax=Paenalcaligenes hermetiae TaxID=1157987 RepID=A0ABP9M9X8_9BURK